jgi:hypothetical protein
MSSCKTRMSVTAIAITADQRSSSSSPTATIPPWRREGLMGWVGRSLPQALPARADATSMIQIVCIIALIVLGVGYVFYKRNGAKTGR